MPTAAVWLATSPEASGVTARFFEQGAEVPCELPDEGDVERLWQACEELAGPRSHRLKPSHLR